MYSKYCGQKTLTLRTQTTLSYLTEMHFVKHTKNEKKTKTEMK